MLRGTNADHLQHCSTILCIYMDYVHIFNSNMCDGEDGNSQSYEGEKYSHDLVKSNPTQEPTSQYPPV